MQKYHIYIFLDLCLLTVQFEMPVAGELLQWICVGGCGCPSSCKVSPMILTSFAFRNSSPSSASAANSPTSLSIWNSVNIAPLRCMGCLSCGFILVRNVLLLSFFHIKLISRTHLGGHLGSCRRHNNGL